MQPIPAKREKRNIRKAREPRTFREWIDDLDEEVEEGTLKKQLIHHSRIYAFALDMRIPIALPADISLALRRQGNIRQPDELSVKMMVSEVIPGTLPNLNPDRSGHCVVDVENYLAVAYAGYLGCLLTYLLVLSDQVNIRVEVVCHLGEIWTGHNVKKLESRYTVFQGKVL